MVFDDVWQRDFWEVIKHAFPSSNKKSDNIIITTRNTSVAYSIKDTPLNLVHDLKPWSSELFCKKAFPFEFEKHCPQGVRPFLSRHCKKMPRFATYYCAKVCLCQGLVSEIE